MKTLAGATLLGCLAFAIPAFPQGFEPLVGKTVTPTVPLEMHTDAPKWWSWKLPETTKETLQVGQPVQVLEHKSHNTLLGQDDWYLVRTVVGSNDPAISGWVLGNDGGHSLFVLQ